MKKWLITSLMLFIVLLVSACQDDAIEVRNIVDIQAVDALSVSTFTGFDMLSLPAQATVTLDDGTETLVRISWDAARLIYDAATPGQYVLPGQPIPTGRVTNEAGIELTVTVSVSAVGFIETLEKLGHYSLFLEMVETAQLAETLESMSEMTVFAPTDEAFNTLFSAFNLPRTLLMELEALDQIVLYHVLDRARSVETIMDFAPVTLTSLSNDALSFSLVGPNLLLNENVTVGASNHIIANGYMHEIDRVLIPPNLLEALLLDLIGDDMLDTLFEILVDSGLILRLISGGRFTIFAPNEDAFMALASSLDISLDTLLALEQLPDILAYHIIEGQYLLDDLFLAAPSTLPTLYADQSLTLETIEGTLFVNGATILSTESLMEFGIVHIIDRVLLPDEIRSQLFD